MCEAAAVVSSSAVSLYELVVMSSDLYFPSAFILITSTVCTSTLPSNEVKQSNESVIYWVSWFRLWFYTSTASHLLLELLYSTVLLISNN